MEIVDLAFDERVNGLCATVVCTYEWYLNVTQGAERNLDIQRGVIKDSKAYRTLRADLKRGCVLPPLVLAVSLDSFTVGPAYVEVSNPHRKAVLLASLQKDLPRIQASDTYIVDGLQRTNALRQTLGELGEDGEAKARFLKRPLRVEVWLNLSFGAVAYRMLLLNAGQKPMSIKHQVEVLSMKLSQDLSTIPGIDIKYALGGERRTKPGQFTLAKLAQAFQSWLQGTANIDVRNTVMEQLLAESAIDTLGTSLSGAKPQDDFRSLVEWFVKVDGFIYDAHPQFFGNDTVLLGIAAAVGSAQRNDNFRDRMRRGLNHILTEVSLGNTDVLAVNRFNELRQGQEVSKVNVGQFTRDMVFRAFQEYFMTEGLKPMEECWAFGAGGSVQSRN
jgi:hypothetical protein